MALILLRHTTPDVPPGTCYGRTDLGLASSFDREAEAVLSRLPKARRIITSPLTRCQLLADRVASAWRVTAAVDDRLREMDFGSWECVPWKEIPRGELDQWSNDFMNARPHGGESVAMLQARTLAALKDAQAAAEPTLLVTHSGVIKSAFARGPAADDFATAVDFGEHIDWTWQGGIR